MLAWGAEQWSALGNVLLGFGAVTAGVWSVFNYRKNRRSEAARWLQGVFRDFYLDNRFERIRHVLEYNFDDTAAPLLERRVTDRHVPVGPEDLRLLKELDDLLNYFEYVLYLEEQGHITNPDRQAVFEYWFEIMSADERASLRRYASFFGFERIAEALTTSDIDYVAVYGSLMSGLAGRDAPDVTDSLEFCGPCEIRGTLVDLGEYPGLVAAAGPHDVVLGELYRVLDRHVFHELDKFERYDPLDRDGSLYIRRLVRLVQPALDAWVYVYNRESDGASKVLDGDWRAFVSSRQRSDPGRT